MKRRTVDRIVAASCWMTLVGFVGLVTAFVIYAVPEIIDAFGPFYYWLTVVVPYWFLNTGLAAQIALVSAFIAVFGMSMGTLFSFYIQVDNDKTVEPEFPL